MSSFNNVEKIKYSDSADGVVTLEEYIVFEDERAEQKFVVFKFSNNISQQLLGMEFEVSQYDIDGELVEKSVVIYNKFLSKPNKSFVPNAKLKVHYSTKRISVRLIKAAFDRFLWNEGEYLDNSYKFEHYAKDRDYDLMTAPAAKPAPRKAVKEPKKRKKYLPFKVKNATRKNIAKFPGVFNFFVCLIVFVAIGVGLYFFPQKSTGFTYNNYDLKVITGNDVAVYGYDGTEENLVIPAEIKGYTIKKIESGAFKNSTVKSVSFSSPSLVIENGAFENCKNLLNISSPSSAENIAVKGEAFKNCSGLNVIDIPKSYVSANAYSGCTNVEYISFYATEVNSVSGLFGGTVPAGLKEENVICLTGLPDDFFTGEENPGEGEKPVEETFDPAKAYAYGEIAKFNLEGYVINNSCEMVNGEILTVNISDNAFTIPNGCKSVSPLLIKSLYRYNYITVVYDVPLEVYSAFTGATAVHITDNVTSVPYGAFDKMPYLESLRTPYFEAKTIVELFGNLPHLKRLEVFCTDKNTHITYGAFNDLPSIEEITVGEGFNTCESHIISGSTTLQLISLPAMEYYYSGIIGSDCTNLAKVEVSFKGEIPIYFNFNYSYEATKELEITCADLPYGFLRGTSYFDSLVLNFTAYPTYDLSSLFGTLGTKTIGVLTLNCDELIDKSFADGINLLNPIVNNSGKQSIINQ